MTKRTTKTPQRYQDIQFVKGSGCFSRKGYDETDMEFDGLIQMTNSTYCDQYEFNDFVVKDGSVFSPKLESESEYEWSSESEYEWSSESDEEYDSE